MMAISRYRRKKARTKTQWIKVPGFEDLQNWLTSDQVTHPNPKQLEDLGLTHNAAAKLAQFIVGHDEDAKRFIEQTAAYCGASPKEVVDWFNQPYFLSLPLNHPGGFGSQDANGKYGTNLTNRPQPPSYLAYAFNVRTIGDLRLYVMRNGHPLPGTRPDFEALNKEYLHTHGMKSEAADILSQFFADRDVKPFLEQTAAYLHVSTADVINWFDQQGPRLWGFAALGLDLVRPDANGHYSTERTPGRNVLHLRMKTIADLVDDAQKFKFPPFPGSPQPH
jgi:hypothetical protein